MNILFLCHRIPYPFNKGDKIRSFNELQYLSRHNNIYIAFLIDNKHDFQYIAELKKYCVSIDYDVLNPLFQRLRVLPFTFFNKPLSVYYFYSKKLQNAIDLRLSKIKFDVILVFSSAMAEYVFKSRYYNNILKEKSRGRLKLIIDFVDVDSYKWYLYSKYKKFPESIIYKKEWKSLREYEKIVGNLFDLSVFVSEEEAKLFRSFAPGVKSIVIPNGVDVDYFSRKIDVNKSKEKNEAIIMFSGAMNYYPNDDGVRFFCNEIWPQVRNRVNNCKFYVVGMNPSKKLRILARNDNNIVITGQVKDIREYLWKTDVFVAPLRIARGIQNKVLEAMASGLPIVATTEAVKGINYSGDNYLFLEDSNKDFADRVIKLIKSKIKENDIKKRIEILRQRYSWENHMSSLENIMKG
jgi:sugar transferase (PEP-CTERM/EpsH1 system associated)